MGFRCEGADWKQVNGMDNAKICYCYNLYMHDSHEVHVLPLQTKDDEELRHERDIATVKERLPKMSRWRASWRAPGKRGWCHFIEAGGGRQQGQKPVGRLVPRATALRPKLVSNGAPSTVSVLLSYGPAVPSQVCLLVTLPGRQYAVGVSQNTAGTRCLNRIGRSSPTFPTTEFAV